MPDEEPALLELEDEPLLPVPAQGSALPVLPDEPESVLPEPVLPDEPEPALPEDPEPVPPDEPEPVPPLLGGGLLGWPLLGGGLDGWALGWPALGWLPW